MARGGKGGRGGNTHGGPAGRGPSRSGPNNNQNNMNQGNNANNTNNNAPFGNNPPSNKKKPIGVNNTNTKGGFGGGFNPQNFNPLQMAQKVSSKMKRNNTPTRDNNNMNQNNNQNQGGDFGGGGGGGGFGPNNANNKTNNNNINNAMGQNNNNINNTMGGGGFGVNKNNTNNTMGGGGFGMNKNNNPFGTNAGKNGQKPLKGALKMPKGPLPTGGKAPRNVKFNIGGNPADGGGMGNGGGVGFGGAFGQNNQNFGQNQNQNNPFGTNNNNNTNNNTFGTNTSNIPQHPRGKKNNNTRATNGNNNTNNNAFGQTNTNNNAFGQNNNINNPFGQTNNNNNAFGVPNNRFGTQSNNNPNQNNNFGQGIGFNQPITNLFGNDAATNNNTMGFGNPMTNKGGQNQGQNAKNPKDRKKVAQALSGLGMSDDTKQIFNQARAALKGKKGKQGMGMSNQTPGPFGQNTATPTGFGPFATQQQTQPLIQQQQQPIFGQTNQSGTTTAFGPFGKQQQPPPQQFPQFSGNMNANNNVNNNNPFGNNLNQPNKPFGFNNKSNTTNTNNPFSNTNNPVTNANNTRTNPNQKPPRGGKNQPPGAPFQQLPQQQQQQQRQQVGFNNIKNQFPIRPQQPQPQTPFQPNSFQTNIINPIQNTQNPFQNQRFEQNDLKLGPTGPNSSRDRMSTGSDNMIDSTMGNSRESSRTRGGRDQSPAIPPGHDSQTGTHFDRKRGKFDKNAPPQQQQQQQQGGKFNEFGPQKGPRGRSSLGAFDSSMGDSTPYTPGSYDDAPHLHTKPDKNDRFDKNSDKFSANDKRSGKNDNVFYDRSKNDRSKRFAADSGENKIEIAGWDDDGVDASKKPITISLRKKTGGEKPFPDHHPSTTDLPPTILYSRMTDSELSSTFTTPHRSQIDDWEKESVSTSMTDSSPNVATFPTDHQTLSSNYPTPHVPQSTPSQPYIPYPQLLPGPPLYIALQILQSGIAEIDIFELLLRNSQGLMSLISQQDRLGSFPGELTGKLPQLVLRYAGYGWTNGEGPNFANPPSIIDQPSLTKQQYLSEADLAHIYNWLEYSILNMKSPVHITAALLPIFSPASSILIPTTNTTIPQQPVLTADTGNSLQDTNTPITPEKNITLTTPATPVPPTTDKHTIIQAPDATPFTPVQVEAIITTLIETLFNILTQIVATIVQTEPKTPQPFQIVLAQSIFNINPSPTPNHAGQFQTSRFNSQQQSTQITVRLPPIAVFKAVLSQFISTINPPGLVPPSKWSKTATEGTTVAGKPELPTKHAQNSLLPHLMTTQTGTTTYDRGGRVVKKPYTGYNDDDTTNPYISLAPQHPPSKPLKITKPITEETAYDQDYGNDMGDEYGDQAYQHDGYEGEYDGDQYGAFEGEYDDQYGAFEGEYDGFEGDYDAFGAEGEQFEENFGAEEGEEASQQPLKLVDNGEEWELDGVDADLLAAMGMGGGSSGSGKKKPISIEKPGSGSTNKNNKNGNNRGSKSDEPNSKTNKNDRFDKNRDKNDQHDKPRGRNDKFDKNRDRKDKFDHKNDKNDTGTNHQAVDRNSKKPLEITINNRTSNVKDGNRWDKSSDRNSKSNDKKTITIERNKKDRNQGPHEKSSRHDNKSTQSNQREDKYPSATNKSVKTSASSKFGVLGGEQQQSPSIPDQPKQTRRGKHGGNTASNTNKHPSLPISMTAFGSGGDKSSKSADKKYPHNDRNQTATSLSHPRQPRNNTVTMGDTTRPRTTKPQTTRGTAPINPLNPNRNRQTTPYPTPPQGSGFNTMGMGRTPGAPTSSTPGQTTAGPRKGAELCRFDPNCTRSDCWFKHSNK